MIVDKLQLAEIEIEQKLYAEYVKLQAVKSLLRLLKQIDFSSEILPEEQPERLLRVLVALKGSALSEYENKLVQEMVKT